MEKAKTNNKFTVKQESNRTTRLGHHIDPKVLFFCFKQGEQTKAKPVLKGSMQIIYSATY